MKADESVTWYLEAQNCEPARPERLLGDGVAVDDHPRAPAAAWCRTTPGGRRGRRPTRTWCPSHVVLLGLGWAVQNLARPWRPRSPGRPLGLLPAPGAALRGPAGVTWWQASRPVGRWSGSGPDRSGRPLHTDSSGCPIRAASAQGAPHHPCTTSQERSKPRLGRQPRVPPPTSSSRCSKLTRGVASRPRAPARRHRGRPRRRPPAAGPRARAGRRRLRGGAGPARGRLRPAHRTPRTRAAAIVVAEPAGEVRLQASWSAGQVVVWAAGPGTAPATNDELADRLEAIGGPAVGWSLHPGVPLPIGRHGGGAGHPGRRSRSAGWSRSAAGSAATASGPAWPGSAGSRSSPCGWSPTARSCPPCAASKRREGKVLDLAVRWVPALVDEAELDQLAAAMPGPVAALATADARADHPRVLGAVVDAIVREAAGRLELPAPPPVDPHHVGGRRGVPRPARRLAFDAPTAPRAPRSSSGSSAGPSRSPAPRGRAGRAARPARQRRRLAPRGARAAAPRATLAADRAWPWSTAGHQAAGRRAGPPRAHAARAAAGPASCAAAR